MKKKLPLVSVIIPCYNAGRFLLETVESVFQQTINDYEIILVDDGSEDNTPQIIESFGAKVRTISGPNHGVSAARNLGTQLAQGEYIQYLDADDLLPPHALERRVQALVSSGADIAYSDWQRLEESPSGNFQLGDIIARRIEDIHVDQEIAIFTSFWAPPAALLYRLSIVNKIGGWNENFPVIEDARFLLEAAFAAGVFTYVPGLGAYYRIHSGESLSRKDPLRFATYCYINACQIEAYWSEHGGLTDERRKALAQVYDYTARTFFVTRNELFSKNLCRLYHVEPEFRRSFPKVAGFLSALMGHSYAYKCLKFIHKLPKLI